MRTTRMKTFSVATLLTFLSISCSNNTQAPSTPDITSDTIAPVFLKQEEAALLLQKEDNHIRNWSLFDLAAHTADIEGSKEAYLKFAGEQARDWSEEEIKMLQKAAHSINQVIRKKGLKLTFPEEVRLLKTTMKEEGGAGGYTREDYIVLIDKLHPDFAIGLLAHETFHILTRNNPDFRKKMYELIGFSILPQEIEFPQELKDRFISNPDVVRHDSYATFTINGEKKDCCMVIYSQTPYQGGSFFNYLNVGLVPIDAHTGKALEKDGKAIIHSLEEAADFYDKVGRNTAYVINPEEVLADNFSFLLAGKVKDLHSPELIQKIEEACK